MKKKTNCIVLLVLMSFFYTNAQQKDSITSYISTIKSNIYKDYKGMYRKGGGSLVYPFLTPGSNQYDNVLWDWDSWLSNIALRQILMDIGSEKDKQEALKYEQGCVLNFLHYGDWDGYLPIVIWEDSKPRDIKPENIYDVNMHKPVLAQHAAFITQNNNGNAAWIKEKFYHLQAFVNNYKSHHQNKATGLYYWQNDVAIGVDNDPSTFFRPNKSSASIYLNCLMYKELQSMVYLANQLNLSNVAKEFALDAENLKTALQNNCWDERDGFFYSVDLNLRPVANVEDKTLGRSFIIHSGYPRDYDGLIQRIGVWSGFLALWSGIATPEQADRIVKEHYLNTKTFNAPAGVRTLSKMEKMYSLRSSANPSNWRGPIWGISNYMVFKGLVKYGYTKEATELAKKTIRLFGNDFQKNGALHEYYEPESGEPMLNKGFQNWNYLVINMIAWLENKKVVEEF
ncbi:MGH1-like glycoside hydrolase domain-containing protein [Flavobacterium commune]|uniref:Glycoside hydrolase family 37 n=1 Tax=Flavobacterium commune TaxID=1306519 RepID=A0A1D9PEV3_9FLAO|nr:trehalase family glycosidase [Flavobacterium commune]APA01018.1 glycoside hydrolase family 37 [Flavobacterium commune]